MWLVKKCQIDLEMLFTVASIPGFKLGFITCWLLIPATLSCHTFLMIFSHFNPDRKVIGNIQQLKHVSFWLTSSNCIRGLKYPFIC